MVKRSLKDLLLDHLEAKNITPERLSAAIGFPEVYLSALLKGDREKLPPFPYVRGHLVKIAEALDLDKNEILALYRNEFVEKSSGPADRLPLNRFALPRFKRRWFFIGGAALIIILYLALNSRLFGEPYLRLTSPPAGQDPLVTASSTITLAGEVAPGDKLTINSEPIPLDSRGAFTKEYQLSPDLNIITFTVRRFLGRELRVARQVYFRAQ